MTLDRALTTFIGGLVTVMILTTILGRSNTPRVLDSAGSAGGNLIRAALGAGSGIR